MSEQVVKSESTGGATVKASTSVVHNWVLVAYSNPDARPGVVAGREEAARTLRALQQRAKFEASLLGVRDPSVAADAVGELFAKLAESNLLANFERARGTPRRYINRILCRTVLRVIHERRGKGCPAGPLPSDLPGREPGPAAVTEARDLEQVCKA